MSDAIIVREVDNNITLRETTTTQVIVRDIDPTDITIYSNDTTHIIIRDISDSAVATDPSFNIVRDSDQENVLIRDESSVYVNFGGAAQGYTYTIATPSTSVTISHLLGRRPSVEIIETPAYERVWAEVSYPSISEVKVDFSEPITALVYLI